MADWQQLLTENSVSPQFDELHARVDNYQIYSILICDYTETSITTDHSYATALPPGIRTRTIGKRDITQSEYDLLPIYNGNVRLYGSVESRLIYDPDTQGFRYQNFLVETTEESFNEPTPPTPATIIDRQPVAIEREESVCIAYLSFSPVEAIPYDLSKILLRYMARLFNQRPRIDCYYFPTGHPRDNLQLPTNIVSVATSSRKIRWSYYRKNELETHPRIFHTLDYRSGEIDAVAGKPYLIPLINPCLGTLTVDAATKDEVINLVQNNRYAIKFLFEENLQELCDTWDAYYPEPLPPNNLASSYTITKTGEIPALTYITTRTIAISNNYRLMGANNNKWNNGTANNNIRYPSDTHALFKGFDHQLFFETIQPDGSYGVYMTNSPEILEIHRALNAGKYSTPDPDTNAAPVVNIATLIEKIAAVLGYRPDPNGLHSIETEKNRSRKLLAGDAQPNEQDYGGNYFGNRGMLMKRLPNTFNREGAIAPGGVVQVHDLPQMLLELIDTINLALGIQESGAIEIKDGDKTRRYANQLQLLKDIALTTSGSYQLSHQSFIAGLVTQQQTGEIISGLGLPTVARSINTTTGGQLKQVPYWGIAPERSIQREISALGYNLAVVTGQLI